MARPKSLVPSLGYHTSGQAICQIDGTMYYLGKHGSPESLARYAVLIREYQANGLRVPSSITSQSLLELIDGFALPAMKVDQSNEPVRIKHLAAAYQLHAEKIYAASRAELYRIQSLCKELTKHDGETLVEDYGPKKLKEQRERWVASGKCRKYCNRLTCLVVSIFGWGVSDELIEESTWTRLKSVTPLKNGQTTAPESEDRKPADLKDVRKTVRELSPVLKSMVRIQVATGMRPTELCTMWPCDIDQSGEEWLYRPASHKNKSKGKDRVIPILDDAREALAAR